MNHSTLPDWAYVYRELSQGPILALPSRGKIFSIRHFDILDAATSVDLSCLLLTLGLSVGATLTADQLSTEVAQWRPGESLFDRAFHRSRFVSTLPNVECDRRLH
jgi:hypothetical protein